jgi:hypothetical protein
MTKLEDIQKAATELSDDERKVLRAWLDELDEQAWDAQIERDAKAGKLDKLAAKALADYKAGRTKEL